MYSLLALFALPMIAVSASVSYERRRPDIAAKSQVELSSTLISCGLNDIAIVSAPVVDTKAIYRLHKPNNQILDLDIPRHSNRADKQTIAVKYINKNVKSMYPLENYRVITHTNKDEVKNVAESMRGNEFMMGPLLEEDHGNWVLSVYFKDTDDNWTEIFQVITIEIVETVPVLPSRPELRRGDTLHLSFAHPIKHLKSCELIAPSSTYDRFYDRSRIDLNWCGYVVSNVTTDDEGVWGIVGVGDIVYKGRTYLMVD